MAPVELSGTWRTSAAPEAVWDVVSDLERWSEWWPAISEVRARGTTAGGLPEAAELRFDTVVGPLTVPVTVPVRQPPDRIVVKSDGGGFEGEGTLTVAASEEGSDIAYEFRMRARKLWLKPVETVLAAAGRSGGKQRLREAGDRLAALAGGEPLEHDV